MKMAFTLHGTTKLCFTEPLVPKLITKGTRNRYILFVPSDRQNNLLVPWGQTFSFGGGVGNYDVDGPEEEEEYVSKANIVVNKASNVRRS